MSYVDFDTYLRNYQKEIAGIMVGRYNIVPSCIGILLTSCRGALMKVGSLSRVIAFG
jgi:hypothetical protein